MKRAVSYSRVVRETILPLTFGRRHGEGKTFCGENIYCENQLLGVIRYVWDNEYAMATDLSYP